MHRFKDDPEWGRILGRIRAGQDTEADRKKINERFLGLEEVELPDGGDVCYAVFKNNERNSISAVPSIRDFSGTIHSSLRAIDGPTHINVEKMFHSSRFDNRPYISTVEGKNTLYIFTEHITQSINDLTE